jgi:succinate-semialdehyde dehydrogenase / glutarate-semialdehyde dehydrogenase
MSLIISTNPADYYAPLGSIESSSLSEITQVVAQAHRSQVLWADMLVTERVRLLRELYDRFASQKETIATSIATEMGMPIRLARDEVAYGLSYMLWNLDHSEESLAPEVVYESDTEIHTIMHEPKWVIAAITPWNYPFMLCIWACVQPLLAGNTVIWKISKEVILTGRLIGSMIEWSSLPAWVWTEIYGDGHTGDLLTDADIDGITFTGSTRIGNMLSKKALEKGIAAVMELGGSAPGVVCEDADIDAVLETIYYMRYSNSWQMCDGLKRLIVHTSRYDELVAKLSDRLLSKKLWNPLDPSTDIGPLVSSSQLISITEQYDDAIAKWATVLATLPIAPDLSGAYFAPVILGKISTDMRVWREEVFGPILPIVTFDTLEHAITLANDTEYGLGAYVFTENRDTFAHLARHIESGMVQMNNVNYCIPSDPFGGYKSSGIGRENGKYGFHELCNTKVISMPK